MRFVYAAIVLVICIGVAWGSYSHFASKIETEVKRNNETRLAVTVVRVESRPIVDEIELVGSLEAGVEVVIRARRRGYITKIPHDVGSFINGSSSPDEASDILIELDQQLQREQLAGARAAFRVHEAETRAQEERWRLAQKTLKRHQQTLATGAITEQEYEEVVAKVAIAQAELALSRARLAEAASTVQESRIELGLMTIKSPITGHVAERLVEVGDLATPDEPLMRVVAIDKIKTVVHVAEQDYPKIHDGQRATVQVDPLPDQRFTGKVVRKAPVLDPETRTAQIHIDIPNTENSLKPGMHARVKLIFERREHVRAIPISALVEKDRQAAVFVVEGNPPVAKRHSVRLGLVTKQHAEVLHGLEVDQQVITLGSRLVQDGQKVTPTPPPTVEYET